MRSPSFWSYIKNDKYRVGCTELAQFKDLKYAYHAAFSPKGDIFAVKTTDGRLGIYSLSTLSLIKKFRFSKIKGSQDDNFCFSPDGQLLFNIERQKKDYISVLSVYSTDDFNLVTSYFEEDNDLALSTIEYGSATGEYFILGFERPDTSELFSDIRRFVARFSNGTLCDKIYITGNEYAFYYWYKECEACGFTKKSLQWSELPIQGYDVENLEKRKFSLEGLWTYYREKETKGVF